MNAINQTWLLFDKVYFTCTRLQYVDQPENIFRVRLIHYRGKDLRLSDGTIVQNSDTLVKIHLHNCRLMKEMQGIEGQIKRAYYVHERVQESLPGLAKFIVNHPCYDEIKGVLGITLLHRGVKRLGFDAIDIPNPFYEKLKQLYLAPMFVFLQSAKMAQNRDKLKPKFLAMSRDKLLQKYLNQ